MSDVRSLRVSVGFDADSSPLDSLNEQMNELSNAMSGCPVDQLDDSLAGLAAQSSNAIPKVEDLKSGLESVDEGSSEGLEEAKKRTQDLGKQTKLTASEIDNLKEKYGDLDSSQLAAIDSLDKASGALLAVGAAATAAGVGIFALMKKSVDMSSSFNAQLSKVAAKSGATAEEIQNLKDTAVELNLTSSLDLNQVAAGMEDMATKGFKAHQIMAAMPGIIAATEASGEDMATVSDTVTSALNAFGMEASSASHIADVMAMTANATAANVSSLAEAFKYAAPIANQLGVKIEGTAAMTGVLANSGIAGSQAGTTLKNVMMSLASPSDEAAKVLQTLGVNTKGAYGKLLPMTDILKDMQTSMSKLSNTKQTQILKQLFGEEAAAGALVLMKNSQAIDELTSSLEKSGGAAAEAAAKMLDNYAGDTAKMQSSLSAASMQIGSILEQSLRPIIQAVTNLINKFLTLPGPVKKFVAVFAGLSGVALNVGGSLLMATAALPKVIAGMQALSKLKGNIATVWSVFSKGISLGPMLLVVTAIAAVIAVVKRLWDTNKAFRGKIITAWTHIQISLETAINAIKATFGKFVDLIKKGIDSVIDFLSGLLESAMPVIEKVIGVFVNLFNNLKPVFENLKSAVSKLFSNLKPVIQMVIDIVGKLFEYIKPTLVTIGAILGVVVAAVISAVNAVIRALGPLIDAVGNVFDFIGNICSAISALFRGDFTGAWEYLKSALSNVQEFFGNIFNAIVEAVKGFFQMFVGIFKNFGINILESVKSGWNAIKNWLGNAMTLVVGVITYPFRQIGNFFSNLWTNLKELVASGWEGIKTAISTAVSNIWTGITDKLGGIKDFFVNIWSSITGFLSGINLFEIAGQIMQGLIDGIANAAAALWESVKNIGSTIVSGIKGFFGIKSPSTVMMEIGGYVSEGMALGIEGGAKQVQDATNSIMPSDLSEQLKDRLSVPVVVDPVLKDLTGPARASMSATDVSGLASKGSGQTGAYESYTTDSKTTNSNSYVSQRPVVNQSFNITISGSASKEDERALVAKIRESARQAIEEAYAVFSRTSPRLTER